MMTLYRVWPGDIPLLYEESWNMRHHSMELVESDGGAIYNDGTVDLTGDTIMYNMPDNCAPGTITGGTG